MTTAQPTILLRDTGPAVEKEVARDLVLRGVKVLPVGLLVGAIGWGYAGAASTAFAGLLILANFWVSAALLAWAARTSLSLLMGVSLFGFLVRIGAIIGAVLLVADQAWVAPVPLGATLLIAHLGLLFWEARFVSASLAFPGLKPGPQE